jgi:LysR family glycine cleavage system transcriptional activator
VRKSRGVTLTKAGQELAQTVEACLDMLEKTTIEIKNFSDEITLHTSPTIARKWLTPRLPLFSERYQGLRLSIEADAKVLDRALRQIEVALRHGKKFREFHGQNLQPLVELEFVAICSPDLFEPDAQPKIDELLASPLIQDTHRRWDKLIRRYGSKEVSKPLNFNSASLAIDAAINGQGIAIVPLLFVQDDIDAGRLVKVWHDQDRSAEFIFLAWPQEDVQSRSLMDVVRWLHECFGHAIAN